MNRLRARVKKQLLVSAAFVLSVLVYVVIQSCGDSSKDEVCDNGIDDDGDGLTDCEDFECREFCISTDGDSDIDADSDVAPDGGGDGDADSDVAPDGGGDGDGDAETVVQDGEVEQDSQVEDTGPIIYECGEAADCRLVFDMMECCGGFPHRVGPDVVACPTATHVDRVAASPCAIPWSEGDPIPTVPEECEPYCDGVVCTECVIPTRVECVASRCMALSEEECTGEEGDCPAGHECVLPAGETRHRCVEGSHDCEDTAECETRNPACEGCRCDDTDGDGLRACYCWGEGCGSTGCITDRDCEAHEFCIDTACVYQSEDVCRIAMLDCGICGFCEAGSDPERGTCVPLEWGDSGPPPDGGCT